MQRERNGRGLFTPEELEEIRRIDKEIEAEALTIEEIRASQRRDRAIKDERRDSRQQKGVERQRAYRAANREKILEKQRARRAANREAYNAYIREYRRRKKEEQKSAASDASL